MASEDPGIVPADDEDETDVIGELMGHYGKWQLVMTVLLSLFQVPNTFHISSPVYQAANKEFWCQRPAHLQQLPVDIWRNLSKSEDNCHRRAGIDWSQMSNDTLPAQLEVSTASFARIAHACNSYSSPMPPMGN